MFFNSSILYFFNEIYLFLNQFVFAGEAKPDFTYFTSNLIFGFDPNFGYEPVALVDVACYSLALICGCFLIVLFFRLFIAFIRKIIG